MREKEERQKPLLKWAGFREIISSYRFMTQDTLHCTPRCTTPCCYFYHFSRVRAAQLLLSLAAHFYNLGKPTVCRSSKGNTGEGNQVPTLSPDAGLRSSIITSPRTSRPWSF